MEAFKRLKGKFIGDKAFYRGVFTLVLPLVIQQGITNFVNLLDNVMVGRLGTESISGVAIVNQLVFVFNLAIFGALSGASIFGAQYAGAKDYDGVKSTFRFKLWIGAIISIVTITLFSVFGDQLITLYLNKEVNSAEVIAATMLEAKGYLGITVWGFVPFMLSQCFGTTLRENGDTVPPMIASIISIVVNLILNYILIYGKFGFEAMGVRGAALATVISRYVEFPFLLIYVMVKRAKLPFMQGAFRSLRVPMSIVKRICKTGWPLLLNETLWSVGMALINQCYSVRGLHTVAAINITSTAWNLFAVIMFGMGNAIAIMVGQQLGAGEPEKAKDTDRKLIVLTVLLHVFIGALIIALSGVIPLIYKTEPEVRELTSQLLVIAGAALPLHAFVHGTYFTIRSGGRTIITFLFDSVFTWVVSLSAAYLLCNFTTFSVPLVYACLQFADMIKVFIAVPMLKSGTWARNVITDKK